MKLLIYDASRSAGPVGLSWKLGARIMRRFDKAYGATRSWLEALSWANAALGDRPLEHFEFWGHGHWGSASINHDWLTYDSLTTQLICRALLSLGEHCSPSSLIWFRTCSTFGNVAGQRFAWRICDLTGARVAGHTYSINAFHSGLHSVRPCRRVTWPVKEGVRLIKGREATTPAHPFAPHTVTCLASRVPRGW